MGVYLINKCPFAGMSRTQALYSSVQAVAQVPGKLVYKLPSASFVFICSGKEAVHACIFFNHVLSFCRMLCSCSHPRTQITSNRTDYFEWCNGKGFLPICTHKVQYWKCHLLLALTVVRLCISQLPDWNGLFLIISYEYFYI